MAQKIDAPIIFFECKFCFCCCCCRFSAVVVVVVVGARYAKVATGALQHCLPSSPPPSQSLPASLLSNGICMYQYTGFMCLYCEFEVSLAVRAPFLGHQQRLPRSGSPPQQEGEGGRVGVCGCTTLTVWVALGRLGRRINCSHVYVLHGTEKKVWHKVKERREREREGETSWQDQRKQRERGREGECSS